MGTKVPILQGVKVPTTITMLTSKSRKYRYPHIRVPAVIKALVEGRLFEAKIIDERTVYYVVVSQPTPTSYRPKKVGNSVYIRLPIEPKSRNAIIELTEDGFIVHLEP